MGGGEGQREPYRHAPAPTLLAGNFGPNGTRVDSAVYTSGGNASTQVLFTAANCTLTVPHSQVRRTRRGLGVSAVGSATLALPPADHLLHDGGRGRGPELVCDD